MTWDEEKVEIECVAREYGLEPELVAAVRKAENGSAGREFGILSVDAPDFPSQLRTCCATLRRYLYEYGRNPFVLASTDKGHDRLSYSPEFIQYAAKRYAPQGASNDPTALNSNWSRNVNTFYRKFIVEGLFVLLLLSFVGCSLFRIEPTVRTDAETRAWQQQITTRVNEHDTRLNNLESMVDRILTNKINSNVGKEE